ncbi:MAG: 50S ribosomal protein L4, partial [Patescibacteria group bacterium]
MKVDIFSEKGIKGASKAELSKGIFEVKPNETVLRQFVRVYEVNQRVGTVATKTRSEVSGGGRKPWAQKGTGRARHGSIRSPIWVGGGITFGPKPRTFELSIPKRVKELALKSALSQRAKEEKIFVIADFAPTKPKTAEAVALFKKLKVLRPLLVVGEESQNAALSLRNLQSAQIQNAKYLNAYDV